MKAQEGKQRRGGCIIKSFITWLTWTRAFSLHNKPLQPILNTPLFSCQRIRCSKRVILRTPPPVLGLVTQTSSSNRSPCLKTHYISTVRCFLIPANFFLQLCTDALQSGWTKFKVKVGADLEDDRRRCRLIRHMIGPENILVEWYLFMLLFYS